MRLSNSAIFGRKPVISRIVSETWNPALHALVTICLLCSVLDGNLLAKAIAGPHSQVALISEDSTIAPGHSFWVGLQFKLEPNWHIYWVNPGDSGEPPVLQWRLPEGVSAGQIQWPAPQRIEAFTLVDYGYEGDVLLPVLMHAAATLTPASTVKLAASVRWLICYNTCIPAQGELSLSLPVERNRPRPDGATLALFERARAQMPKPMPPGWRVNAISEQNDFVLSIDSTVPEAGATFFPLEAGQIKDAAPQQVLVRGRRLRLRLIKSDQLMKPIKVLNGVVVFSSGPPRVVHARVERGPQAAARSLRDPKR
ncbi:MAG: protein-disulfide reductase DsbD domain-containing protein [Terriglobia bacterium]